MGCQDNKEKFERWKTSLTLIQGSQTQIERGPVRQPKSYGGPHLIFSSR
jgi:hypothetical protein